nr:hypothetical protein [Tanacetum cinerariifolium]
MALDEALVATTNRLKIGKGNQRLSPDLKSNKATIQVVLDALKLTPVYNAFLITTSKGKISRSYSRRRNSFFISDLGHSGEITVLTDVNVNSMHQPWRSFSAIVNMCLSGKTTSLNSLRLSHAQIIWGIAILPDVLTSQDMLESKAYKEYYAFATGAVPPKAKTSYKKKAKEPVTSKTTSESISKSPIFKTQAKTKQPAKKTKEKGDGVGKLSKVPNEQEQEDTGTDEGTDTLSGVPDVPKYESESDDVAKSDNEQSESKNDDDGSDEDEDVEESAHTYSDEEKFDYEELNDDDDESTDTEDDEEVKELYDDVNINLGNADAEMTDADQKTTK